MTFAACNEQFGRTRNHKTAILLFILVLSHGLPAPTKGDSRVKNVVAISMIEVQRTVANSSHGKFSTTYPEVYFLGGITWPWAVVSDPETHDWILVGERDPAHSVLTLDDWATAIRARFLFPEMDPGVTILPNLTCDFGHLAAECLNNPQRVEFFAGIENTDFGAACLEADILLKKITLGLESPTKEVEFESLSTLLAQHDLGVYSIMANRFWIYPLVSEVNVADNVAIIQHFRLGVLTEVMYARDRKGGPVDPLSVSNWMGERIAADLTNSFSVLAGKWRELDRLQGLGRLAGLAKGLRALSPSTDIERFLSVFQPKEISTSKEVAPRVLQVKPGAAVAGGVQLDALVSRLRDGNLSAFGELVLASRPKRDSVIWEFTTVADDGRLTAIEFDRTSADAS